MRKRNVLIMAMVMALFIAPVCSLVKDVLDGPSDDFNLTGWAQTYEDEYIQIRNAAAMKYRSGELGLDDYNVIRAACCAYSTASNAAFETYAANKDLDILQARIRTAMDKLKAKVAEMGGAS